MSVRALKWELPYATVVLTIFEVAAYYTGTSPSLALPMPLGDARWWRTFTSIFAHADGSHLASNMVAQVFLLSLLEVDAGTAAATYLYLASGLCGSLAQAIVYDGSPTILLGASGAVFGLIGGHMGTLLLNCDRWRAPVLFALSLLYIANEIQLAANTHSHVARHAHLIGALSGFTNGILLTVNIHKEAWEGYARWIAGVSSIVILIVLSILYVMYG